MVGSSMNGFSTSDCDLDLCMMTPNQPVSCSLVVSVPSLPNFPQTPTRQDAVERLCEASNKLREKKVGRNHQVISAKTPIIKYSDPHSGFEVDISVNNQHVSYAFHSSLLVATSLSLQGIRNTNLLHTYSQCKFIITFHCILP